MRVQSVVHLTSPCPMTSITNILHRDGQPRSHRRRTSECSSKKFAANYKINELTDSDVSMFRHPQIDDPLARLNAEPNKKCVLDVNELISKLERVKHEKDQGEAMRDGLEKLPHPSTDHAQLLAAVCQKIGPVMDDGEDILDAHLSRVGFSPKSLSGVTSPCQGQPPKLQPKKRMPPPPVLGGFNNISSLPKCKPIYLLLNCHFDVIFQLFLFCNIFSHTKYEIVQITAIGSYEITEKSTHKSIVSEL